MILRSKTGLTDDALWEALGQLLADRRLNRVLLLPPDYTRMYSCAGKITAMLYALLDGRCQVDILPALGTHEPMTRQEASAFFGPGVPFERILVHNWRTDVVKLGEIPAEEVANLSGGRFCRPIDVEVNRRLLDPSYDLILSIGQVVPHEVVGMANYSKNIFVGCGGSSMIHASHMLGAVCGMERAMGRDFAPVRRLFDYAEQHFIGQLPLQYILTVTTNRGDEVSMHGLFIGRERALFEQAVALSQQKNLIYVERPLQKVVVYLDEREFKSTWLGNKAIYRTRMAIADGGALLILAPGVRKFGEDEENDRLIRRYGYVGRERVLALTEREPDLRANQSVAAHLIHGSSDGRFSVTYAPRHLTRAETEGAGFGYLPYDEAVRRYDPRTLRDGWNILPDGEEIYFISNPAVGLWALRERIEE